jgi:pyruvate kinase
MRKAKILATIGPASASREMIDKMLDAGLNAVRINMSHGTQEGHAEVIRTVREAAAAKARPVAILVDLSGPKIRTRTLENGAPVVLHEGERFTITSREIVGNAKEVSTNFEGLPAAICACKRVLINSVEMGNTVT